MSSYSLIFGKEVVYALVSVTSLKLVQNMSNAAAYDDEICLLEAIRGSVGEYTLEPQISEHIYPYTWYILTTVSETKLDGQTVSGISDERVVVGTVTKFEFSSTDFKDIGFILKEVNDEILVIDAADILFPQLNFNTECSLYAHLQWLSQILKALYSDGNLVMQIERPTSMEMDAHLFALSLPRILQSANYTMNFILVGTLAAFAVTHGVWLLVLKFICADSSNRKEDISMILKRVEAFITLRRKQGKGDTDFFPEFYIYISLLSSSITRMPSDNWKSMGSLDSLIMTMLKVISEAHLFLNDVFEFISESLKDEFDSLMLLSIYWVTRGVLACSSECHQLPKHGYIIQGPQELEDIREKLDSVLERLQKLDAIGKQYMEDEKISNAYQIPNKEGRDNYFALMAFFGLQPDGSEDVTLLHCSENNMDASVVSLRHKTIGLIISGLNITSHEIDFLSEIYVECMTPLKQAEREFIWLPMYSGPWTTSLEEKYVKLKRMMPWYTVHQPTFLKESTKQFIRDIWKFHRKPIVVVLNEDGNVVCPNAIHLMYVWRAKAFPYTRTIERTLWREEKRLDSFVLGFDFDPHIPSLLKASKCVILYGGTDIGWIRKFISRIREVSVDSGTFIELILVGKTADGEKIRETISSIAIDMAQIYSLDSKKTWYFWTRLESLLITRCRAITYSTEPIIREVQGLLSYASAESWACLITPSSGGMMIHGVGDLMLQAFMEYDLWKHLHAKDLNKILYMYVEQLRQRQMPNYPCSRIVLQIDDKDVVENLCCSHCFHSMEKKIQYRCCHTEDQL